MNIEKQKHNNLKPQHIKFIYQAYSSIKNYKLTIKMYLFISMAKLRYPKAYTKDKIINEMQIKNEIVNFVSVEMEKHSSFS